MVPRRLRDRQRRCSTRRQVLILVLIVIWAALVFWTYADARRRIDDPMLVACATAALAVPVRRHDRLHDRAAAGVPRRRAPARARDDRGRGAAGQLDYQLCPHCDYEVGRTTCAARAACAGSRSPATVREAGRPAVACLPVLRGRDAAGPRRPRAAAGARPPTSRRSPPGRSRSAARTAAAEPLPPRTASHVAGPAARACTSCWRHGDPKEPSSSSSPMRSPAA